MAQRVHPKFRDTFIDLVTTSGGGRFDATSLAYRLEQRWSEPHRVYHTLQHLEAALRADERSGYTPDPAVWFALWFHDAVFDKRNDDEERSAHLAHVELLSIGVDHTVCNETERLVALTASHTYDPTDVNAGRVVDADVEILAAKPNRYRSYLERVRKEYAHVDERAWKTGRAQVLQRLLDGVDDLYHTRGDTERARARARANLNWELGELAGL